MSNCISNDMIKRHIEGQCSEEMQCLVTSHLAGCETCRRRVESAQSTVGSDHPLPCPGPSGAMPKVSQGGFMDDMAEQALETLFDNYQILDELPRGGQAAVYKAIHKPTKRKVAIKVLLPTQIGSAKARRHFEREVELAASLNHPNIVRILDSGVSRGQYFFAMEYIHGMALDEHFSRKTTVLKDKVILFNKVCDAMSHAHQRGVIHRDLKPSNIIVDERDDPRILDFGLAKSALPDNVSVMTMTGDVKGTVSYMSPEQAKGRPDLVDIRSDVYSLGVILYRLLVGQFPYDVESSSFAALKSICEKDPIRPCHIIRKFDSDLETILLKSLAKNREYRYQSAAELKYDLDCWNKGFPILAKSMSSVYLIRKAIIHHRQAFMFTALVVAILVSFASICLNIHLIKKNALRQESAATFELLNLIRRGDKYAMAAGLRAYMEARSKNDTSTMMTYSRAFPEEALEGKMIRFWEDPNEPEMKRNLHFSDFPKSDQWALLFCMAEDYRARKQSALALEYYQKSKNTLPADDPPSHGGDFVSVPKYLDLIIGKRLSRQRLSGAF